MWPLVKARRASEPLTIVAPIIPRIVPYPFAHPIDPPDPPDPPDRPCMISISMHCCID
jgi:hypothetical protein